MFRQPIGTVLTAGVAQLVRAPVCGTGGRRFKTGHSPHSFPNFGGNSVHRMLSKMIVCWYQMKKQMIKCGRGGIGRRAGFRYQWRESWGFESLRPHHLT